MSAESHAPGRFSLKYILPIGFLIFAALLWFWLIPDYVSEAFADPNGLSPRFFPYLITLVMAVLALARIISIYRTTNEIDDGGADDPIGLVTFLGIVIIYACYFLIGWVGMVPACIIAMLVIMVLFRIRNPISVVAYSVGVCTLLFLFFEVVASIPIPRGSLFPNLF